MVPVEGDKGAAGVAIETTVAQIETGTSFIGELNESAKKKGGHRRFDGVVAGEASTTLPGLWCECAKSRAARQNRRG